MTEVAETPRVLDGIDNVAVYGVAVPGSDGRTGMAAIVTNQRFDWEAFAGSVERSLREYARPVFVRQCETLSYTGTFKADLVRDGYAGTTGPVIATTATASTSRFRMSTESRCLHGNRSASIGSFLVLEPSLNWLKHLRVTNFVECAAMAARYQDLETFRLPEGTRGRSSFVVAAWQFAQATAFACSPQYAYAWRRWLLRLFGAKVGKGVLVRQSARVTYPWFVTFGDHCWIGDHAEIYSVAPITIGANSVVSQRSYICAGTHDHMLLNFPVIGKPVEIGDEVWVATDCFVGPGVRIGRGAIVAARSTVTADVREATIVAGNPAEFKGKRVPSQGNRLRTSAATAEVPGGWRLSNAIRGTSNESQNGPLCVRPPCASLSADLEGA